MNATSVQTRIRTAPRGGSRSPLATGARRAAAGVLGGLLLVGLAACEPTTDNPDVSSAVPAASSAAGAAAAAGSAGGSAVASSGEADAAHFCQVVSKQRSQLAGTALSGLLAGGSPQAWKAYLAQTSQLNSELLAASPPEIKPDVQTLKTSDDELAATLAAADYQPQKVGSAKLIAIISSPQRREASTHLTAYTKTTCGIDLTATPSA